MPGETTNFKIPYAEPTDEVRLYPTAVSKPSAERIAAILGERLLNVSEHGASFTAASGELVKATGAITVTLPAAAANATVGVLANGHEVTVGAGAALIFLGGTAGITPVTISGEQWIVLQSDGTNWFARSMSGVSAKSIIATEQETNSLSFTTLPTPDQVAVTLPENGLIAVGWQCEWSPTSSGGGLAAIFIGTHQLRREGATIETNHATGTAFERLSSCSQGLANSGAGSGFSTTGELLAGSEAGGPCYVYAAAGTYKVSVQFKNLSGSVKVRNRKLWAWVV